MSILVIFSAALVVGAVAVLAWALRGVRLELPSRRRELVRANLGPVADTPDLRQVVLEQPVSARIVLPAIAWCADLARRVTPTGLLETLERRRRLAGLDARWTLERVLAVKVVGGFCGLGLGLLVFLPNPTTLTLLGLVLLPMIGFFGLDLLLEGRGRERRKEIEHAFPNALDQVTICVEAGLGMDAAIAHAARSGRGPLAEELARVLQDVQVGVDRQTALESLAERTDVPDIRHFVVAVGQANRYGVPVAQALRVQAMESRERRRQRAEERAQKMGVTLLFPLVFCIMPSLFIVLVGPAAIRIANLNF